MPADPELTPRDRGAAIATMTERPPWRAQIALDELAREARPVLVVSGRWDNLAAGEQALGHRAFGAVCDVLDRCAYGTPRDHRRMGAWLPVLGRAIQRDAAIVLAERDVVTTSAERALWEKHYEQADFDVRSRCGDPRRCKDADRSLRRLAVAHPHRRPPGVGDDTCVRALRRAAGAAPGDRSGLRERGT